MLDAGQPRFNMPLELGIFLGAKRFGLPKEKRKRCLVLDEEQYRYRIYCSDISGQDLKSHGGDWETAIEVVRNWLRDFNPMTILPGGRRIQARYEDFRSYLPIFCEPHGLDPNNMIFNDFTALVYEWLKANEN